MVAQRAEYHWKVVAVLALVLLVACTTTSPVTAPGITEPVARGSTILLLRPDIQCSEVAVGGVNARPEGSVKAQASVGRALADFMQEHGTRLVFYDDAAFTPERRAEQAAAIAALTTVQPAFGGPAPGKLLQVAQPVPDLLAPLREDFAADYALSIFLRESFQSAGHMAMRYSLGLLLPLAGCLIVPVPIPPSGTTAREVETGLDVGVTERAQVHELFGEPTLVIDDRHELFDLAVDPFHFWILMAVGGPGYASGHAGRTGQEHTYGLAVVYDEADHVAGWRVLLPRTGVSTGKDGRLRPAPPAPIQIEQWRGDQVLLAPDGRLLVLSGGVQRPIRLTQRDGHSGKVLREAEGAVADCGKLSTSALTGSWPPFGLDHGQLVSVPPEITADAAPCRWAIEGGGSLVATRIDELVRLDQSLKARLMGDLVLRERPDGGVDILTLAGEPVAHLPMPWPVRAAASDASRERVLLRIESDAADEPFWLLDRAAAGLEPVPEMAPAGAAVCSARHIALAPGGELAALRCGAHIEVWRLPLAGAPARLLEVLPLPQDARGPELAFTPDGSRLVFGARGFVVWRAADWTVEAFLSSDAMEPAEAANRVLPIADGSRLATPQGLWRIDGDAAAAHSVRRAAD